MQRLFGRSYNDFSGMSLFKISEQSCSASEVDFNSAESSINIMCAPKKFEQPSLVSSSSSSSILSSLPQSPNTIAHGESKKKWSAQKVIVAIISGVGLVAVSLALFHNGSLSFRGSTSTCSLNGNSESGSCTSGLDSEATSVPSSQHRGKIIGAKVNAKDVSLQLSRDSLLVLMYNRLIMSFNITLL